MRIYHSDPQLPPLPPVLRELVGSVEPHLRECALLALLPPLGAVGTGLRAKYRNGKMQSPTFFCLVEAASGNKSWVDDLVGIVIRPLKEQDDREREKERRARQQIKKARAIAKSVADIPDDYLPCIRVVAPKISAAKFGQRLEGAKGKHLFTFSPEVSTVTQSFAAGKWANLNDVYCKAYNNDTYEQDYMNDDTWSGSVPIYFNFTYCGTPKAIGEFVPADSVQSGFASRIIFAHISSELGAPMPRLRELTPDEQKRVDDTLVRLQGYTPAEPLDLGYVNEALEAWDERIRIEVKQELSQSKDYFRKRAQEMGFRAALLASGLYGADNAGVRRKILALALWLTEKVLSTHDKKFGKQQEAVARENSYYYLPRRQANLYMAMPDEFTLEELKAKATELNVSTEPRQIRKLWADAGFIRETLPKRYEKIARSTQQD